MIGSSWWKRVRNWNRCDWPDFLTINQFWDKKLIGNCIKVIRHRILLHFWYFPCNFFARTMLYFGQKVQISENITKSKNVGRTNFLVGIGSECFKTYFNPIISKSKIFLVQLFLGLLLFGQDSVLIHRNHRSFQFRARLPNYRLEPSSECIRGII